MVPYCPHPCGSTGGPSFKCFQPTHFRLFPGLITRYVLWELTKIFVVSSIAFVSLLLLIGVADEASDNGLGPDVVIRLVPFILPKAMMFSMPATCLFSACVVFGRLAADNELIALQSMGLRKSVVILPALAIAFVLSLFAVWVNDISFAWSYWGVERVVLESSDKIIYGMLENEGSFRTKQFSIEVDGVNGRQLIRPVITFHSSREGQRVRIAADEAELSSHPERYSLNFTVSCGVVDVEGRATMRFDDSITQEIPLKSPDEIAKQTGNPAHLYLSQIRGEIDSQHASLNDLNSEFAIHTCSHLLTGDLLGLTTDDWKSRIEQRDEAERRIGRLRLVPHRRWASGFSCLAFAFVGIPVAIKLKSANYATTFGVCFLPILLMYYPLFMLGLNGAKEGTLPPIAAWLGNAACMIAGAWIIWSQSRK